MDASPSQVSLLFTSYMAMIGVAMLITGAVSSRIGVKLATVAVTALLYNFGFFTLLAFTPFPLEMSARQIGLIFFGWGIGLALTSVFAAPRL